MAADERLGKDFGAKADLRSCPSFTELRRDGFDCAKSGVREVLGEFAQATVG
jgi:pyruvate dehydrogenase complex dehydrogenase (E1) component